MDHAPARVRPQPGEQTGAAAAPLLGAPDPGEAPAVPLVNAVSRSFPNPFRSGTSLTYAVAEAAPVRMEIYDVSGRRVKTIFEPSGDHDAQGNSPLPPSCSIISWAP